MSSVLLEFVLDEWCTITLLTILFALYFHYTSTSGFFEDKGIEYLKPTFLIGNMGPRLKLKISFHDYQKELYDRFAGLPYGGFFEGRKPLLLLREPDLIKAVLIRDFDHFVDRNALQGNEPNYLKRSLIHLKGHDWKSVRSIVSPTFSSSRLRAMLPIVEHCSTQMVELLRRKGESDVEMKEFMGRFTLEVIGTCAFGIKCAALKDEPSHFVKVAEKFADMTLKKRLFIFFLVIFMPEALRYIKVSFMNLDSTEELVRMLKVTKGERRSKANHNPNISSVKLDRENEDTTMAAEAERRCQENEKNDFLQLLIDVAEEERKSAGEKNKIYMDEDTIDAQSLLFLLAGYETSSTLLSFAAHVLAIHPRVQDEARAHVQRVLVENGGRLTYETIARLDYLESVLLETLRMYPPLSRVDRVCTQPYTLPGTNVSLKEGDVVAIPVYGLHMDPLHYPEPRQFRPERFSAEARAARPSHLHLPFGVGPRHCLGQRFAMVSVKLAMATLLMNFEFSACEKTEDPVPFEKKGFLVKAQNGLWVHVRPTNQEGSA